MSDRIERIILRNLFYNEDFTRKALPFIKSEFFTNHNESTLFGEINEFVNKYKNLPTKETILVKLNKSIRNFPSSILTSSIDFTIAANKFYHKFYTSSIRVLYKLYAVVEKRYHPR